jgi:hypothetical protein
MKRSTVTPPLVTIAAVAAAPTLATWQSPKLPAGTVHGPASRLQQYPDLSLATRTQKDAAVRVLVETSLATRAWGDPRAAAAAGFGIRLARRKPGDRSVHWLHAEHRGYSNDRIYLDPSRPEVLIYANPPGRPLVLVGVMFSVPRGVRGPARGGAITRWHTHRVCVESGRRGLAPQPDGTCPRGSVARQGSEMMHLWSHMTCAVPSRSTRRFQSCATPAGCSVSTALRTHSTRERCRRLTGAPFPAGTAPL